MPYSALPSKVSTDTIDLGDYDAIKGNFEAGVPDIFTTKGDLAAATGADAAARVAVGADDATLVADSAQSAGLAWQIQPAARAYNNAAIDPATGSWVTLTFNSERYDTDACHSTSSNTGRLTVPANGGGIYSMGGCAQFDTDGLAGNGGTYGLRVLLNGATILAQEMREMAATIEFAICLATEYALAAADYVELQVWTSQDVNVLASGNFSPEFWFRWERRS